MNPKRRAKPTDSQRYRALVENAPFLVVELDANRRPLYVNPYGLELYGLTLEEVRAGKRPEIHAEDAEKLDRLFGRMLEEGRATSEGAVMPEFRVRDGSGRVRWMRGHASIFRAEGELRIAAYCEDITRERETQRQLHLRDTLAHATSSGICVCDATQPDLPLVFVNKAFERMTGYPAEELLGRNLRFLQGADRGQEGRRILAEAIAAGEEAHVEIRNYRKDGEMFLNELRISPVRNADGSVTHYIGIQSDVTRQRENQESARLNQRLTSIGRLAAGVAHELNNPLGAIMLSGQRALDTVREGGDPAVSEECLMDILADAERCDKIVKSILTFAKEQPAQKWSVSLNRIVRAAVDVTVRQSAGGEPRVELDLSPDLPEMSLNPVGIQQVLVNLIQNALDAAQGDPQLTLRTARRGDRVELVVADAGVGVKGEELENLFEPFYTTRRHDGGTGLGLSIAHGIISDHGGTISIESPPEGGTVVTIELPIEGTPPVKTG